MAIAGPLERVIMEALWDAGEPLLVRAVMERVNARAGKPSAYTTVQTVADRLVLTKTDLAPDCEALIAELHSLNPDAPLLRAAEQPIGAAMLFDDGVYEEHDADLVSTDPLQFTDTKPYSARLKAGRAATGMKDALVSATGRIEGRRAVVCAMEYGRPGAATRREASQLTTLVTS